MKLSSSAWCGCCFCCYCRSWLTMLLMVSSVIHVSTEMSTTKAYTSLNNYYQTMTELNAKLNLRLPRPTTTGPTPPMESTTNISRNTNEQLLRTPKSDMGTQMFTVQTQSTRVPTLTTAVSPEQILTDTQRTYETTQTGRGTIRRNERGGLRHRSPTSDTFALIGDNYDVDRNVVSRTIDTGDGHRPTETLGDAASRTVQITALDGHESTRITSAESRVRKQNTRHEAIGQNTKHVVGRSSRTNHRATHAVAQKYHEDEVQRTNNTQTPAAWLSSKSKQYMPIPTSTSGHYASITTSSSNNNKYFLGDVIEETNIANRNTYYHARTHSVLATTIPPSKHSPRLHSTLAPILHNQLGRPTLQAFSPRGLHRFARQAEEEQIDKCRTFVEGNVEKNELYSPDYPNIYPKNMNCTRVITAPKGQIIRLDFRNSFNIEMKEDCKFDFLEIRDGQYGFSNLIGKYCGTDFPPEITSKERYLWMFFHSDESIEYDGFTAVYEFIDRNRDAPSTDLNCTIEKDGFEGFINSTDVPQDIRDTVVRNKIPLDCMWRIQVQDKWKIQVKFIDFKLSKPNDCETNFLDIFPEQTVMPARVKNFCGSAGEGITSDSNILHMRFYAEQSAINSTFAILYTAFRDRGSGACVEEEYDCEDATCIAAELKCNGRDNCKFRWDEEGCKLEDEGQSEHMIIIITVFGLILGGMVITFLVNCIRKIMHDQKIIREHIRQSKESKLDEMGRRSKTRSRDNISIVSPRQKHSQTSLQILDDVSNRYYREMELQAKGNYKEKDPNFVRRHDMIVQTSLCSTDDSSATATEQPTPLQQTGACDMGCQTRESLFGTASLLRSKSKTPSMTGSHRTVEGVPPPPRFSTFGYDAAQIAAAPPPPSAATSTLSRRNIHLPQDSTEAEQPSVQTHMTIMPPQQQQQQHRHLHHRPSQEVCHHHHQHQQQQQQKHTLPRHQHQHLQDQHYHASTGPQSATMTVTGTSIVTAVSTGSSAGRGRDAAAVTAPTGAPASGVGAKGRQTKGDESKIFIDIRNSAPDVIIMTSH